MAMLLNDKLNMFVVLNDPLQDNMLKQNIDNKMCDHTIEIFIFQLVCHSYFIIVAFNANLVYMIFFAIPNIH